MFMLGGVTTMYAIYPKIVDKAVAVSFRWLIFEKWVRIVPLILSLVALEFCWPLIGSGPFYKLGSKFVLDNCSKYWLLNVLQISNWSPALEKVSVAVNCLMMMIMTLIITPRSPDR